jgi:release factor glutamine methyltransferase
MNTFQRTYYNFFLKPLFKIYLRLELPVRFDGFKLKIKRSVFHPNLYFSTKYFYDFLNGKDLTNKKFLEIGCGSGILSLLAQRKKAIVHVSDINPIALENSKYHFKKNFGDAVNSVFFYESDVFEKIPQQKFDCIIFNPPYFFKAVENLDQYAWNCGENGEYFEKLFSKLSLYSDANTNIYMILADNCDIERIKNMAAKYQFILQPEDQKKIKWEMNFIFRVQLKPPPNYSSPTTFLD